MISLIEFPADDRDRALAFWSGLLGADLQPRTPEQGSGWQTGGSGAGSGTAALGVHERGTGPGDRVSLPYFATSDMAASLERVTALGGSVVHPGERWSICRDSEGSPFGLALGEAQP